MSLIDDPAIQTLSQYLDVNAFRGQIILSNMANIDTPGYRTQDINFQQALRQAGGDLELALFSPAVQQVEGLIARPDGNNVSMERESLLLAQTQMRFNTAVQLLRDEFKTLSSAISGGGGNNP